MKYLKKGESILPVTECYAYRYDYGKGKTVLRINCSEAVAFADIQNFFGTTDNYEYYEGEDGQETLQTIYTQYGADVDIHYKKTMGTVQPDGSVTEKENYFDIEVLRDPSIEASVRALQWENTNLKGKLAALEQDNIALEKYTSSLESDLTNAQIALTGLYENMTKIE